MSVKHAAWFSLPSLPRKLAMLLPVLLLTAACSVKPEATRLSPASQLDPERLAMAVSEAKTMRARGQRVWCVPFARNASGVDIRGNANTWWGQAKGQFGTGHKPQIGAVMAFSSTRKLPMGHVAVVSKVISDREVLVDHANWERNKVSLGMSVKDVSKNNDWSQVRVLSQPNAYGSIYKIDGFIWRLAGMVSNAS